MESKIIIDVINVEGKPEAKDALVRIVREADKDQRGAGIVVGRRKAQMLLTLIEGPRRDELIGTLKTYLAKADEGIHPNKTIEYDGQTFGLFGTRMIKMLISRKDRPGQPIWKKLREGSHYAETLKPGHFDGSLTLPKPPAKAERAARGSRVAAEMEAMRKQMEAQNAAFQQTMMEMMMKVVAAQSAAKA